MNIGGNIGDYKAMTKALAIECDIKKSFDLEKCIYENLNNKDNRYKYEIVRKVMFYTMKEKGPITSQRIVDAILEQNKYLRLMIRTTIRNVKTYLKNSQ